MASSANTTLVQELYQTVLARYGSGADVNAWATALDAGALSQTQVIADFVNSPEAVSYIYPIIGLYQGFFGRTPDAGGFQFWTQAFESGVSLQSIATSFANAWDQEGANGGVANTPSNFLKVLYSNLLGRAPDASGLAAWTAYLNGNGNTAAAQAQVFVDFLNSAEFQTNQQAWNQSLSTWLTQVVEYNLNPPPGYPGDLPQPFAPVYTTYESPQGIVSSVSTANVAVDQDGSIGPGSPFAVDVENIAVAPAVTSIVADATHFPYISATQPLTPLNVLDGATIQAVTVTGGSAATRFQVGGESNDQYLPVFGEAAFKSFDASGYQGQISLYLDGANFGGSYAAGTGPGNFLFFAQAGTAVGPYTPTVTGFQTIEFVGYLGSQPNASGLFTMPATVTTPPVMDFVTLLDATHISGTALLELAGTSVGVTGLASGITVAIGDQGNQGYQTGAPLAYEPSLLGIDLAQPSSGLNLILNDGGGYSGVSDVGYSADIGLGGDAITIATNAIGTINFSLPEVVPNQSFDLAIVDLDVTSLVFSGGQTGQVLALDRNGIPATVATIDAHALASDFVMAPAARFFYDAQPAPASGPPPLTFLGGSGSNIIELANAADHLSGGSSGDNTLLIDLPSTNGPIAVTLGGGVSSEVTQFDGAAGTPTVTGFDNLDMSYVGGPSTGIGTAAITVEGTGGSAYDTFSTSGKLIRSYDFVILSPNLTTTVTLQGGSTTSSTIVALDGSTSTALAANANGTFSNFDTITGFGGDSGQRSGTSADQFAFASSFVGNVTTTSLESDSSGGIVVGSAPTLFAIVGTGAADLTNEASVISVIGAIKTTSSTVFNVVVLNNADPNAATEFGVYQVNVGTAHFATGLGVGDTIQLLGIFDTSNGWDSGLFYHGGTIHSV